MYPFQPHKTPNGVIQSGLPSGRQIPTSLIDNTFGTFTTAVVLATYFPADEDRVIAKGIQKCITCDVRTTGRIQRYLARVPVLQWHQLFDEDIKVPRPAMQDISGGTLVTETTSATSTTPTAAESMDADHVIVTFLDNNPNKPVILPFCLPHPNARNVLTKSSGGLGLIRRIRHHGTKIEIESGGNLNLDATGAAKELFGSSGTEQSNSGTGGAIEIITNDGTNDSSIKLDTSGGITLTDGSSGFISMTKATKNIAINTGSTGITVTGNHTISAGGSVSITATGSISQTAASVTITAASVITGVAALAMPLVKYTPWISAWNTLKSIVDTQDPVYDPSKTGTTPVNGSDYHKLLQGIQTLVSSFSATTTINTKAS